RLEDAELGDVKFPERSAAPEIVGDASYHPLVVVDLAQVGESILLVLDPSLDPGEMTVEHLESLGPGQVGAVVGPDGQVIDGLTRLRRRSGTGVRRMMRRGGDRGSLEKGHGID